MASQKATERGQWKEATSLWGKAEDVIANVTNGVNFYNILDWNSASGLEEKLKTKSAKGNINNQLMQNQE